jgi:hypothetical protein
MPVHSSFRESFFRESGCPAILALTRLAEHTKNCYSFETDSRASGRDGPGGSATLLASLGGDDQLIREVVR